MPTLRATERRHIEAEVSMDEIYKAVRNHCHALWKFPGEYINRRGKWEIDHGGHGSGYQEELRDATPEEDLQWQALKMVLGALHTQLERRR